MPIPPLPQFRAEIDALAAQLGVNRETAAQMLQHRYNRGDDEASSMRAREVAYFKNKVDSRGRTLSDGLQRLSGIFQDVKEVPILRTIGAAIGAVALGAQYVAHRTWTVMRREAKGYSKFELH